MFVILLTLKYITHYFFVLFVKLNFDIFKVDVIDIVYLIENVIPSKHLDRVATI